MKMPPLYFNWLQQDAPSGGVDRYPELTNRFETSVPLLYCIGDLTGIPLIKLAAESGHEFVGQLAADDRFNRQRRGNNDPDCLDLIIIGGGPSGVSAALAAGDRGYRYLLLESSRLFTTIANFPVGKPIYVTPADPPAQSGLTFTDGTRETLLDQLQNALTGKRLAVREGEAALTIRQEGGAFMVDTDRATYRALAVAIAIGKSGNARRLGVPGEDLPRVFSRLIDPGAYRDRDILVVGGGDSAVEAAVAIARNGNRVTISYRKAALARPKEYNLVAFGEEVKKGSIKPRLESTVREIREGEAVLATPGGDETVPAHAVYALIGSEPPQEFFKRSGIRLQGERHLIDRVGAAALLLFAVMLYFGKKSPCIKVNGIGDFFSLPAAMVHLPWLQMVDGLLGWVGFLGMTICGAGLIVHAALNPRRYCTPGWNAFKYACYAAVALFFSYLYLEFKLLGNTVLFPDMGEWYTALYSLTVVVFGLRRMRVRPTGYIRRQTAALIAFQVGPLFLLPLFILPFADSHGLLGSWIAANVFPDHSYWRAYGFVLAWPLFIYNLATGTPALFWLVLGVVQTFVIIPAIVYKWGKGAYCGWVCPCGALAETLGDEYRTRAPHGRVAKKAENIGQVVLWYAVLVTVACLAAGRMGSTLSRGMSGSYALLVDTIFAGVIGLGVYFSLSGRVWCRYLCPLAALMHIYARFSPYRIMANKKRCISCGVCTRVCHMGIDVMNFASRGVPMNDVECVRCSACIVNCPLQVLTFGGVGSIDPGNTSYRKGALPLTPGWRSGLQQKNIDMLLSEEAGALKGGKIIVE